MCLLHEGTPYGYLRVGSKDILPSTLARMIGISSVELKKFIGELESAGVLSRDSGSGTLYSRRMVRDEAVRQARAAGGHKSQGHPHVPPSKDILQGTLVGPPEGGDVVPPPAVAVASASTSTTKTTTATTQSVGQADREGEPPVTLSSPAAKLIARMGRQPDRWAVWDFLDRVPDDQQVPWVNRLAGYLGGLDMPAGTCPTPAQLATACRDYTGDAKSPAHFRGFVLRVIRGPRPPPISRDQQRAGQPQIDAARAWAVRLNGGDHERP